MLSDVVDVAFTSPTVLIVSWKTLWELETQVLFGVFDLCGRALLKKQKLV